ncbi:MAG: putative porin [Verrucomicrobiota bacterium]
MKKTLTTLALAGAFTLGGATGACAQDSGALIDALVRKKVLTSQEAENVRADLIQENAASNAGKLQLSNSITSLKLYGDVRLRYQYDNKDPQIETAAALSDLEQKTVNGKKVYVAGNTKVVDPATGKVINGQLKQGTTGKGSPQDGSQRNRERIRLRLGADFELAGGFFGGVQLQTTQNSDSANQTFDDSATGASGFGNYNIYISRAFVGWNANDWLTLVGGKQANPFYTTDLVWDGDINPDGFVEKIDLLKAFNSLTCSPGDVRSESRYGLSLVAGQFVFADNAEDSVGTDYKTDAWLFNTQLIGSVKVTPDVKVTLAPGFMTYTSGNTTALNNETAFMTTNSAGTAVLTQYQYSANSKLQPLHTQAATRDLSIVTLPGDVSFKLCGLKTKFLWDFAYNTQGTARVEQIYGLQDIQIPVKNSKGVVTGYKNTNGAVNGNTLVSDTRVAGHSSRDDIAWLAGVQVGENKKKGDWSVMANFRQTGLGAVDPNLNDSDFALGQLNMQGVKTGAAYNFTDFCVGAITYYNAWNLRNDLVGGQATAGQKIASMNAVQIVQVDLNVKF